MNARAEPPQAHRTEAIIFDFGGVFTDSSAALLRLRAYDQLLRLPPGTLYGELYGGEPWHLASAGLIPAGEFWALTGERFEGMLPPGFSDFRTGMFRAERLRHEVIELALRLRAGRPLALCSNALPDLRQILDSTPALKGLFDPVVISAEVGLRKPDPEIYRYTLKLLGLPAEACLLIDDKERNTEAAAGIGLPAVTYACTEQLRHELISRGLLGAE